MKSPKKPTVKNTILWLALTGAFLLACDPYHKTFKDSHSPPGTPQPSEEERDPLQNYFDHPETIDYSVIEKHIITNYCFKCHSKESSQADDEALFYGDFTSYKDMANALLPVIVEGKPEESSIYTSIAIKQNMPPRGGPLKNSLTQLMRLWILNCAIETYDPNETLSSTEGDKVRNCEAN